MKKKIPQPVHRMVIHDLLDDEVIQLKLERVTTSITLLNKYIKRKAVPKGKLWIQLVDLCHMITKSDMNKWEYQAYLLEDSNKK